MPTVSLFWKSWRNDLKLLQYSLRSVKRHWKEPGTVEHVVAVDYSCHEELHKYGFLKEFSWVKWRYVNPWPDGYTHQMVIKGTADEFCEGEMVLVIDSDLVFREDTSLDDFTRDGNPVIHYEPYSEKPSDGSEVWIKPTTRCLGVPMEHDFMVQGPFLYWSSTFLSMRRRVVNVLGRGFIDAVYSDVPFDYKKFMDHPLTFSEFNCLGLYAWNFELDRYAFERSSPRIREVVYQIHSWTCEQDTLDDLEEKLPA